jgi:hypothetical protein
MYYVYSHIRLDTNEPFYVGKGKGERAYATHKNLRNKYWNNVYNKCGKNIQVIINFLELTEEEALKKEIILTEEYLEKGYKLTHISPPGLKGSTGHKKSDEWKKNYSELMKQINSGRILTETHKLNLSKSLKGRKGTRDKKVIQYSLDGKSIQEYPSAKYAERLFKIYPNGGNGNGINNCCRGIQETAHKFKWKYKSN